uniref:Uncharacterized protein n=1 Tax=viral metagenome TaxID=1070528 RepID=A0A6H1ZCS1_9ZZZZ
MLNCPVCQGFIVISTKYYRGRGPNMEGHLVIDFNGEHIVDKVFCEDCKILFHHSKLGKVKLIDDHPGWMSLEE